MVDPICDRFEVPRRQMQLDLTATGAASVQLKPGSWMGLSLMGAVLDSEAVGLAPRVQKLVAGFADLMLELTASMYAMSLTEFTAELIEKTGYVRALEASKTEENAARIENIREFEGAVSEYQNLNPEGTLSDFLENVALISDMDNLNESGGAVTLMTLHSAKGLEFDVVFLVGMEEGVFPITRALFDENALEEERRLAYVGITRAKKQLYLSHARTRMLYNSRSANQLSRFVGEIPPRLIRDGAARTQTRVPAPRPMSSASAQKPALGIPGLWKGAAGVQSAPKPAGLNLFRTGDRVTHAVFGKGTVEEMSEDNAKVTVRFDSGALKRFSANIAPLRRIDKRG